MPFTRKRYDGKNKRGRKGEKKGGERYGLYLDDILCRMLSGHRAPRLSERRGGKKGGKKKWASHLSRPAL